MFRNTSVKVNLFKDLMDIKEYHYSKNKSMSDDKLSNILGLSKDFLQQYNNWYLINNKLYYYKDYSIMIEVFLSELAKEFNLKSVDYQFVTRGKKLGIMSESFKDNDSKCYHYNEYFKSKNIYVPRSISSLKEALSEVINNNNKIHFMNDIFKLMSFDILCGQHDRSDGNITIMENNNISLGPIYDNELAFFDNDEYYSSFDRVYLPDYYNLELVDKCHKYLFKLINSNIELFNYLNKALDIDIYKVLQNTIKKYNLVVPRSDKKELIRFFDNRKIKIERTLSLAKKFK